MPAPMSQLEALQIALNAINNIPLVLKSPPTESQKQARDTLQALMSEAQDLEHNLIKRRDAAWDVLMHIAGEDDTHIKVTAHTQDRNGVAGWVETISVWRPEKA